MGNYSGVGRVTWAASSKDKIRVYVEKQFNGEFYNGFNTLATTSPEGVDRRLRPRLGAASQVDARPVEQAAARGRHLVLQPAVRAELHVERRAARSRPPGIDDEPADGRRRLHDSAVYERDAGLQHDGVGELRHRLARDQGRHDGRLGHQLANLHVARRDQHADLQQRRADCRGGGQHAGDRPAEGEERPRHVHPGHVDAQAAHAQLRRALRALQRRSAGRVVAGRTVDRRPATSRPSKTCRTGTTGPSASPARTTCSAPARPR